MTVEVSPLQRLRIIDETAINVSEIASIASFIDVPVVEGTAVFTGLQAHDEPNVTQTHVHGYRDSKMVRGLRSCTLDFTTYLAGTGNMYTGTTITSRPDKDAWSLGRLLFTMMGDSVGVELVTSNTAATVESTGTTTRQIVMKTNTIDTGLPYVGLGFACVMPSGRIEAREIRSYSAGVIVPTMAFSDVPAEDTPIYFGITYHLTPNAGAMLGTLQAVCEGVATGDEHLGMGLQGTFGIDITLASIAKLTVKLMGAGWLREPLGVEMAAPSAYPSFVPIVNMSSELLVGKAQTRATWTRSTTTCTVASTAHGLASGDVITLVATNDLSATPLGTEAITVTGVDAFTFVCANAGITTGGTLTYTACMKRNSISHSASTWQPGFANIAVNSPEALADTNIIGWKRGRSRAVTGSFTAYDEPAILSAVTADNMQSWEEADANRIDLAIQQQIGMTTAGIVLLSAPTVQISAVPTRTDVGGLYGVTVNWAGRNDLNGAETADEACSALRITVF